MTGRKGRTVRDSRGRCTYQLRAKPDSAEVRPPGMAWTPPPHRAACGMHLMTMI